MITAELANIFEADLWLRLLIILVVAVILSIVTGWNDFLDLINPARRIYNESVARRDAEDAEEIIRILRLLREQPHLGEPRYDARKGRITVPVIGFDK